MTFRNRFSGKQLFFSVIVTSINAFAIYQKIFQQISFQGFWRITILGTNKNPISASALESMILLFPWSDLLVLSSVTLSSQ